ncbi:glycosyltransferase [Litoribaculum gwangyangense]|uniref:Glycosyltransferase 2-like domain-containing protein n=1 Tax=Litoribaculum gwangyangense TaxID=1130722 RepID=A0ABP9CJ49_9FLAO
MKTGIIIIFHNYEEEIDMNFFSDYINKAKNIEMCLVNNCSKDNTYEVLKEISEYCNNVSVLNINKFKTDDSAVRAGARYLVNQFNLKEIGFINTNILKSNQKELIKVLRAIIDNRDEIFKHKNQVNQQKKIKQSMPQNVFSILECMKIFKEEIKVLNL